MKEMQVFYWLCRYQSNTSTSLFFHPHEQMIAVVNGSAQVTLVSPLYSEKLPDDEKQLLVISTSKEGKKIVTDEPVLSGHPQDFGKWPLNTGWLLNTGSLKNTLWAW